MGQAFQSDVRLESLTHLVAAGGCVKKGQKTTRHVCLPPLTPTLCPQYRGEGAVLGRALIAGLRFRFLPGPRGRGMGSLGGGWRWNQLKVLAMGRGAPAAVGGRLVLACC